MLRPVTCSLSTGTAQESSEPRSLRLRRTLLTEVDVPNPDGALQPGVYCTVELKIPRKSPALIVPASAIIFNQNGIQVAVVEDGVAHLHKIAVTTDYRSEERRVGKECGSRGP